MIPDDTKSGAVWRCAPGGTTEVYFLSRLGDDWALVCGQGVKSRWARKPMAVLMASLFYTREEAREEFRRRKREAA